MIQILPFKFRQRGATLVDHLEIANIKIILDYNLSGEETALLSEFKISLNAYLNKLVASPVRTMAEVIAFNYKNPELVTIQA